MLVHIRGDSIKEKREICNDMISTSTDVLDAMRTDFEQLPADARSKLLDLLCSWDRKLRVVGRPHW